MCFFGWGLNVGCSTEGDLLVLWLCLLVVSWLCDCLIWVCYWFVYYLCMYLDF